MNNRDYWAKRALDIEERTHNAAEEFNKSLEDIYNKAQRRLTKEIEYRLERMAQANGISFAEAQKALKEGELAGLRDTLEEYEAKVRELSTLLPGDKRIEQLQREIETASARAHITRLEEMQYNLSLTTGIIAAETDIGIKEVARFAYTDGLYHTAYDIQEGVGVYADFAKVDERQIKTVLSKPWKEENFSERVWDNRGKLLDRMQEHLSFSLMTGENVDKAAKRLADDMDVSLSAAKRICRTEAAAISETGREQAYKEMGVESFEVLSTLDSKTCEVCGSLDGVEVKITEENKGARRPPFHANCRCVSIPVVDEELMDDEERVYRDADGKTVTCPDMSYNDWKKTFVDGSDKTTPIFPMDPKRPGQPSKPEDRKPTEPEEPEVPKKRDPKTMKIENKQDCLDWLASQGIRYEEEIPPDEKWLVESINELRRELDSLNEEMREDTLKYLQHFRITTEGMDGDSTLAYADDGAETRFKGGKKSGRMDDDAECEVRVHETGLSFNARIFSDRKKIDEENRKLTNGTYSTGDAVDKSVLAHEIRHIETYALAERKHGKIVEGKMRDFCNKQGRKCVTKKSNTNADQYGRMSREIAQEAVELYNKEHPDKKPLRWNRKKDIETAMGGYAATECGEMIAEANMDMVSSETPKELSDATERVWQKKIEEVYGAI